MTTFLGFSLPSLSFSAGMSSRHVIERHAVRTVGTAHFVRNEGALIDRGQEAVAPERRSDCGRNIRAQHHVARKVLVLGAETVGEPRAHRRTAGLVRAGVHHQARRFVVRNFGVDGTHPADVVGDFAQVRPEFADVHAALAVLLELERRLHQFARAALGRDGAAGQRLAVVLFERRLRIEGIDRGESAVHEQEDDALDALRIIELARRRSRTPPAFVTAGARHGFAEHAGERHHAEAVAHAPQRFSSGERIS